MYTAWYTYTETWPSVEYHAIPFPFAGVANEPEVLSSLLHPLDLSSSLLLYTIPLSLSLYLLLLLSSSSFFLTSVGGALTFNLPLPARLTDDDSTPSHMQTSCNG